MRPPPGQDAGHRGAGQPQLSVGEPLSLPRVGGAGAGAVRAHAPARHLASGRAAHPRPAERPPVRHRPRQWPLAGARLHVRAGRRTRSTTRRWSSRPRGRSSPNTARSSPGCRSRPAPNPAREFCVFDIPEVGRFGLCICYDAWFPETVRTLAWMGAEVILHPTMTPTADRPLELVINQANAIFNQCYFVDVNGVGPWGGGRSMIVDPDGRVAAAGRRAGDDPDGDPRPGQRAQGARVRHAGAVPVVEAVAYDARRVSDLSGWDCGGGGLSGFGGAGAARVGLKLGER